MRDRLILSKRKCISSDMKLISTNMKCRVGLMDAAQKEADK
jgi:hypothetical protein